MSRGHFDAEGFYAALDAQRQGRNITWKKVADESGVSASTLTRLAQGKRPDVDSMASLISWSGLSADSFVSGINTSYEAEPLAQITAYLRADRNLTPEGANALEAVLKSAYERLRRA